jgi:RNA polymerase sigma-70 factor (ECF subfamily)
VSKASVSLYNQSTLARKLVGVRREIALNEIERSGVLDAQEAVFVARLQANEDAAYDELVRGYHASMFHVAYRMLGDSNDAADAVQEIFLKVFRNVQRFRGDSSLKTWIYRIAFSEILNRLRWWKRRFRSSTVSLDDDHEGNGYYIHLASASPSPLQVLESKEREGAIQQALTRLSGEHRSIVILRDIEGFSYSEIAEILGISVGTVKSRLARARADMKKSLVRHLSIQGMDI